MTRRVRRANFGGDQLDPVIQLTGNSLKFTHSDINFRCNGDGTASFIRYQLDHFRGSTFLDDTYQTVQTQVVRPDGMIVTRDALVGFGLAVEQGPGLIYPYGPKYPITSRNPYYTGVELHALIDASIQQGAPSRFAPGIAGSPSGGYDFYPIIDTIFDPLAGDEYKGSRVGGGSGDFVKGTYYDAYSQSSSRTWRVPHPLGPTAQADRIADAQANNPNAGPPERDDIYYGVYYFLESQLYYPSNAASFDAGSPGVFKFRVKPKDTAVFSATDGVWDYTFSNLGGDMRNLQSNGGAVPVFTRPGGPTTAAAGGIRDPWDGKLADQTKTYDIEVRICPGKWEFRVNGKITTTAYNIVQTGYDSGLQPGFGTPLTLGFYRPDFGGGPFLQERGSEFSKVSFTPSGRADVSLAPLVGTAPLEVTLTGIAYTASPAGPETLPASVNGNGLTASLTFPPEVTPANFVNTEFTVNYPAAQNAPIFHSDAVQMDLVPVSGQSYSLPIEPTTEVYLVKADVPDYSQPYNPATGSYPVLMRTEVVWRVTYSKRGAVYEDPAIGDQSSFSIVAFWGLFEVGLDSVVVKDPMGNDITSQFQTYAFFGPSVGLSGFGGGFTFFGELPIASLPAMFDKGGFAGGFNSFVTASSEANVFYGNAREPGHQGNHLDSYDVSHRGQSGDWGGSFAQSPGSSATYRSTLTDARGVPITEFRALDGRLAFPASATVTINAAAEQTLLSIDWGDGSDIEYTRDLPVKHVFTEEDDYTVTVKPLVVGGVGVCGGNVFLVDTRQGNQVIIDLPFIPIDDLNARPRDADIRFAQRGL